MGLFELTGIFCQLTLLWLFAYSGVQKLRDPMAFERSVEGFALVSPGWITPLARIFTAAEVIIVVLGFVGLGWGGVLRLSSLLLALIFLVVTTCALISVLVRGLHVPCGCFSTDERPISYLDIVRNTGLIIGCIVAFVPQFIPAALWQYPLLAILPTTLMAAAFVLVWTHLNEIVAVLQPKAA